MNKTSIVSIGIAILAIIFSIVQCKTGGVTTGLSIVDKLLTPKDNKKDSIRIDTFYVSVSVFRDTCFNKLKLEDLSAKSLKKVNRIFEKNKLEVPKVNLHPLDLIKFDPKEGRLLTDFRINSSRLFRVEGAKNVTTLELNPRDSILFNQEGFKEGKFFEGILMNADREDSTILESPKAYIPEYLDSNRVYFQLPVNCLTSTEFQKLKRNSSRVLNFTTGIDARGYVQGGLMLQSSGGFGIGFYVSSGRYNGLNVVFPIKRFLK